MLLCNAVDAARCGGCGGGGDESTAAEVLPATEVTLLLSWDIPLLRGVTEVTGSLLVLVLVMDSSSLSYARIASLPWT